MFRSWQTSRIGFPPSASRKARIFSSVVYRFPFIVWSLSWSPRLSLLPAHFGEVTSQFLDPFATLARRLQIPDGYAFHGETVHYPALMPLNPSGEEVFRSVGKNKGDRFGSDQPAAEVAELKGTFAPSPDPSGRKQLGRDLSGQGQ
jgi:hypothetical protein